LVVTFNTDEIRTGLNLLDVLTSHTESGKLATVVGAYSKESGNRLT